jgi:hypothetical protein
MTQRDERRILLGQCGFDSRRKHPDLRDVYQDEQDEPRLRDGSSTLPARLRMGRALV